MGVVRYTLYDDPSAAHNDMAVVEAILGSATSSNTTTGAASGPGDGSRA